MCPVRSVTYVSGRSLSRPGRCIQAFPVIIGESQHGAKLAAHLNRQRRARRADDRVMTVDDAHLLPGGAASLDNRLA